MSEIIAPLWRASVQGGIALLLVWVVCRLLHRLPASLRCWLWRLAFLKCLAGLFFALTITVPILPSAPPAALPEPRSTPAAALASPPPVALVPDAPSALPIPRRNRDPVSVRPSENPWPRWLGLLYALGLGAGIVQLVTAGLRTWRLTRRAVVIEHPSLVALSERFGPRRAPRLARSSEIDSPLLAFGTILLPADATADEPLILGHELAHFHRRDLSWEWLGTLTQTLFYFHPLVWLARREERLAREQAADALAVAVTAASPADYARALLAASLRRGGRTPALAVGAVEGGSRLRQRLQALGQPGLPRRRALALGALAGAIAMLGFVPWRAVARQQPNTPVVAPDVAPSPASRGSMSGVITDTAGQPVPNAKVSWVVPYDPKPVIIAETTTNARGEFLYDNVINGKRDPGQADKEYWRGHLDGWVMVKASGYGLGVQRVRFEKRSAVMIRLTPPQTYTAAFRDERGKPIVGLPVWGEALINGHSFFKLKWLGYAGMTDANGEYHATDLPQDDAVWFQFDQRRWSVEKQEEKPDRTRVAYTLGKGHTMEGIVHLPDGRPVPNVNLQAIPLPGSSRFTYQNASSNDQGRYRLVGLGVGAYQFRVWPPAIRGFVRPKDVRIEMPKSATTIRNDVSLLPAAKVVGRVTDTDGKPLSGLHVGNGGNDINDITDSDGRYQLSRAAGEAVIAVEGRDPRTIFARVDRPTRLDFAFPRKSIAFASGQVLDSKGEPIPGTFVSIKGDYTVSGATTDSQGKFSWKSALEDRTPLTVFVHRGMEGAYATILPGEEKPLTLRLSETGIGHVTGQVTDPAGKPIRALEFDYTEGNFMNTDFPLEVDDQGRFSIPLCPDTGYRFRFHAPGYGARTVPALFDVDQGPIVKPGKMSLQVKAGESRDLGPIVLTRGEFTATGRLLGQDKQPLRVVRLYLITDLGEREGTTDAAGRFAFPNVVKGERASLFIGYNPYFPSGWLRRGLTVGEMGTITLTREDTYIKPAL